MRFKRLNKQILTFSLLIFALVYGVFGQAEKPQPGQPTNEAEEVPALLMHLPDWETKRNSSRYFVGSEKFSIFFRDRKIVANVDFIPGTEAVFAKYSEGELLIVEYSTPQASSAVDEDILKAGNPAQENFVYRRIGNYNVFLFDPPDRSAAAGLLDKIKYEKVVVWPYGNPKPFFAKEREFITGATSLFISTVIFILTILGSAIILGAIIGVVYFRARDKRRAAMTAYSDAGGLTRLNIDGLTQEMYPKKLLEE